MKVHNNELIVHRNETFTIDRYIECRDGSPYIVSKNLDNPYLLLTVSSSKYSQAERYVCRFWLDLKEGFNNNGEIIQLPRFYNTKPVEIASFENGLPDGYNHDDAVFYLINENGEKEFKYFNNSTGTFLPYRFRLIKSFSNLITKDWIEQNYTYGIVLVSGTSTYDFLKTLSLEYYTEEELPGTLFELNEFLKNNKPELLDGVNINAPIINYSTVHTILTPTKITVLSNINGGM